MKKVFITTIFCLLLCSCICAQVSETTEGGNFQVQVNSLFQNSEKTYFF
jgi:hypothetical protein